MVTSAYPFFQVKGIRKITQPRRNTILPASPQGFPAATLLIIKRTLHNKKSTQPKI